MLDAQIDEKSLYSDNISYLLSRYPKYNFFLPKSENTKKYKYQKQNIFSFNEESEVIFIYGISAFNNIDKLEKWAEKEPLRDIALIEVDDLHFNNFLRNEKAKKLIKNPHFHIFYKLGHEKIEDFIDNITHFFSSSKIDIIPSPYLSKLSMAQFSNFKNMIYRSNAYFASLHLDDLFSQHIFKNFIRNIQNIPKSFHFNKLKNSFENIPAIICGAGPTLAEDKENLKKAYDESNSLIIAGGTAIASMSKLGLPFHLGVVIDPNIEEYTMMQKADMSKSYLIYSPRVHNKVFEKNVNTPGYLSSSSGGKVLTLLEEFLNIKDDVIGHDLSRDAFSVTTANIAIASFLGCSPIYLCGVDLSFVDNKRYFFDTRENEISSCLPGDEILTLEKEGKAIHTKTIWQMESGAINQYVKDNNLSVYNFSKKGLGFKDIENRDFKDFFADTKTEDNVLKRLRAKVENSCFTKEISEKIEPFNDFLLGSLERCKMYANMVLSELKYLADYNKDYFETPQMIISFKELKKEKAYNYFLIKSKRAIEKQLQRYYKTWKKDFSLKEKLDLEIDIWNNFLSVIDDYLYELKIVSSSK